VRRAAVALAARLTRRRPDVATLFYTVPADGSKVLFLAFHLELCFTIGAKVSLVASAGTSAKIDAKEWLQQVSESHHLS
jgi:hypothetical protein